MMARTKKLLMTVVANLLALALIAYYECRAFRLRGLRWFSLRKERRLERRVASLRTKRDSLRRVLAAAQEGV